MFINLKIKTYSVSKLYSKAVEIPIFSKVGYVFQLCHTAEKIIKKVFAKICSW